MAALLKRGACKALLGPITANAAAAAADILSDAGRQPLCMHHTKSTVSLPLRD
jgi:hypothetical protein